MAAAERHPHAAGAHIGEHRLVLQIGSGKQLAVNQAAFLAVLENLDHQIVLGFELVEDIGAVFRLPQGGGGDGAVFGHSVFFHHLGIPPQHGGERPHRLGADVPGGKHLVPDPQRVFQPVELVGTRLARLVNPHPDGIGADIQYTDDFL